MKDDKMPVEKTLDDLDKLMEELDNRPIFLKFTNKLSTIPSDVYYAVRNFFRYAVIGRIKNGFDVRECWNLDEHLQKYIAKRVNYLRLNTHGYQEFSDEWLSDNGLMRYKKETSEETYNHLLQVLTEMFIELEDAELNAATNKEGWRLISLLHGSLWD
jgi:hypothetical protein